MTDPFAPGAPDGPPFDDGLSVDAQRQRQELAEKVLRASTDAVNLLHRIVVDTSEETKERRMAAQSLLGLAGVTAVTGRSGGPGSAGSDPLGGLFAMLDGRPRSRWAASAVGRQKCPEPACDWPVHRGPWHGHQVDAGFQDGCGYNHSMLDECGPVPDGRSTRSDFWETRV